MPDLSASLKKAFVETDANHALYLVLPSGEKLPIVSPWSDSNNPLRLDRVMTGGWIYYATYLSSGDNQIEVCFVSIYNLGKLISWSVSLAGHYIDQHSIPADSICIKPRNTALIHSSPCAILARYVSPYHNDLCIYQFYKYVVGSDAAADLFIRSYSPKDIQPRSKNRAGSVVHLLVIYNHNYMRNIPAIDDLYSDRFFSIYHVMPNIAPPHPRCLSFPYGSYAYHLAVREGLKAIGEALADSNDLVLVIQDDVMLHPRVCQDVIIEDMLGEGDCCAHPSRLLIRHDPDDSWMWNERITQSCSRPAHHLVGSGFESLPFFFEPQHLYRGVSDTFALKYSLIPGFLESLDTYISMNVFPEVSIPSALKLACLKRGEGCSRIDGIYLWGADRSMVADDSWVRENFVDTSLWFLHPVKISRQCNFS